MTSPTRVAIVTGAATGLGRAIALRLARDGFAIMANDLPKQIDGLELLVREIKSMDGNAKFFEGDVTVEENVRRLVESAVTEFGGLDVMVANAGMAHAAPFVQATLEEAEKTLLVGFRSTFLSYQYAAKQMIAQGRGGRIIGASSVAGKSAHALYAGYSAAKFSVRALTQSCAQELGVHGITVNAYCPGFIQTALTDNACVEVGAINGISADTIKTTFSSANALKRLGQPEDIAGVVSFFASKDSGFVTGQSIIVDGGALFA